MQRVILNSRDRYQPNMSNKLHADEQGTHYIGYDERGRRRRRRSEANPIKIPAEFDA